MAGTDSFVAVRALARDLMDYTPTEPVLVVEVDVSFEHDRWRHPTRYRRVRSDLRPIDLT